MIVVFMILLSFSLGACGDANSDTPDTSETIPVTVESLAGTYSADLWFLDHTITLNENTSYDFGTTEKGTFELEENHIDFYNREGFVNRQYVAEGNYIYQVETAWVFEKDDEYGLAFSPDENGMADQTFTAKQIDTNMPGCDYSQIVLDLNADGTFALKLGHRSSTTADITESFEGTYTSNDSTITLTYKGQDYLLILNDSNHIHFMVYEKN